MAFVPTKPVTRIASEEKTQSYGSIPDRFSDILGSTTLTYKQSIVSFQWQFVLLLVLLLKWPNAHHNCYFPVKRVVVMVLNMSSSHAQPLKKLKSR